MDWKKEAMDMLRQYTAKRQALKSIPAEQAQTELAMRSIRSAAADGTPVQGGGSGREERLLSCIVRKEKLALSLQQTRAWVAQVDAGLAVLSAEERRVLELFYIFPEKGNVERLCMELGLEKSAVYDRREKALRHFTVALYGCAEI